MIRIVVAMPAEARPLIDYYGLRSWNSNGAFPLYRNENMALIVSGIGKTAAAAATAFAHAHIPTDRPSAWLNIGVAGHPSRTLGEAVIAHKIVDFATNNSWYPPQVLKPPGDSDSVMTVDAPVTAYDDDVVYDMEAAAFFPTACRFVIGELAQCYKVISDNRGSPVQDVTMDLIDSLVRNKLNEIDDLAVRLNRLADEYGKPRSDHPEFERFLETWRFSVSQRHRLRRLLTQWSARTEKSPWGDELGKQKSAKDVLSQLEQQLLTLPVNFG
ncbi:MAG: hypothetical protein OEU36_06425 [Gammaproteobacteria bacterium]|nr:hypothetical protein [Gammaproteobacteria bacterium]